MYFLSTCSKWPPQYLCSLPRDEVRRAAENLLVRCRVYRDMGGGHFEHVLKKYKTMAPEE